MAVQWQSQSCKYHHNHCWYLLHCENINKPTASHYHTVIHYNLAAIPMYSPAPTAGQMKPCPVNRPRLPSPRTKTSEGLDLIFYHWDLATLPINSKRCFIMGHLYSDLIKVFPLLWLSKPQSLCLRYAKFYRLLRKFWGTLCSRFKKRSGKGMALQSALSRLRTAASSQSLPPTERRLNNHVLSSVRNAVC